MIITHIMGGIGNQLFQYAIGRALAIKHNTELKLDITQCETEKHSHHNYYRLGDFNIQENFATADEIQSMAFVSEKGIAKDFDFPDNIHLYGYWCNERYFVDIADTLREEFTLRKPLSAMAVYWQDRITSAECPVSLHFRHGDYLTPLIRNNSSYGQVLPLDYYVKCVEELKKSETNIKLFVFSDDLQWAKENLDFGVPIEFVEGCERDSEDLYLIGLCKHNVTARSTFSWWAAWLNRNPEKKVFVPCKSESDFAKLPSNFNGVLVDYSQKPHLYFPPLLSIILYVDNNVDELTTTISTIISQSFKDYELIIVNVGDNNSENICRKFAAVNRVHLLKLNLSDSKFAAWNRGVDCARGEYVLLLDSKDFIIGEAFKVLVQFTYDYLKRYIEPLGKYITYSNYGEIFPNIICLIRSIVEKDDGNLIVNGLPNRKFALLTDAPFKDLGIFVDVKIEYKQKMMLLITNRINNLLGTKLFKRKFLNEYNIRFDEHQRGGLLPN